MLARDHAGDIAAGTGAGSNRVVLDEALCLSLCCCCRCCCCCARRLPGIGWARPFTDSSLSPTLGALCRPPSPPRMPGVRLLQHDPEHRGTIQAEFLQALDDAGPIDPAPSGADISAARASFVLREKEAREREARERATGDAATGVLPGAPAVRVRSIAMVSTGSEVLADPLLHSGKSAVLTQP